MLALAGVAAFILIIIIASGSRAHAEEGRALGPGDVAKTVASANLTADPEKLDEHAAAAERAGYPQTAAAIRERSGRIRSSRQLPPSSAGGRDIPSPVPEASNAAWTRFVDIIAGKNTTRTVSPRGGLGLFQFSLPRLADLGYVGNVHRDVSGKWAGDWVPPYSQERFLGDLKLQYEALVKATRADRREILARHKDDIGRVLARKVVTLSGLLGAARQAGMRGLSGWIASDADRVEYPQTTRVFLAMNGLF